MSKDKALSKDKVLYEWKILKESARMAGFSIFWNKNLSTEREFDAAVEALVRFETEHGLRK